MTKRIVKIVSGLMAGATVVLAAWYFLTPSIPSPFDANGDDRIGYSEFRAFAASLFEQIDKNADGRFARSERPIASEELRPSLAQAITAILRAHQFDADKEGQISRSEFLDKVSLKALFGQLDKDGDGYLTRGEGGDLAFKLLFP